VLATETGQRLRVDAWRGEGSYARVYRATQLPEEAAGALKVAKREEPEAVPRLTHERRILAAVEHPRLVRLLGAGCAYDAPFLLLEWLEGDTVHDLVKARRRLPLRQSLEHFIAACEAVAAIHDAAHVHGDVRAENILVVPGRGAVLTDPGLPPVNSPDEPGRPTDIRCLGELMHLMLTGRTAGSQPVALSTAGGFNRGVVALWESSTRPDTITARDLGRTASRLLRAL